MSEWTDSPERAIENAEGQVAMARALDVKYVQVDAESLAKVLAEVKRSEESTVIEAAIAWHDLEAPYEHQPAGPLWTAVDALIKARETNLPQSES